MTGDLPAQEPDPGSEPTSAQAARLAVGLLLSSLVAHLALAPLRRLTFDEAHYLVASRAGIPWPITYHPPLLGVLLRGADRLGALGLSVEERVRLVPALLAVLVALGAGWLAWLLAAPGHRRGAFALAVLLGSWGMMPFALGFLAVPEAPVVAAVAAMFALATRATLLDDKAHPAAVRANAAALFLATALGLYSKASAAPVAACIGVALVLRRRHLAAAAVALGGALLAGVELPALVQQTSHIAGGATGANQRAFGALFSLAAITVGVALLFSPVVLLVGARGPGLRRIPGGAASVAVVSLGVLYSAVASGRLPEIHWFAPACVPLYASAAARLVEWSPRARGIVAATHVLPTLIGLVFWTVPMRAVDDHTSFFAGVPHRALSAGEARWDAWIDHARAVRSLPDYGERAWREVYRPAP